MPGALPTTRPIFLDEELRNGNYATPVLLRKMIDWCRFTYARDLPYQPCDPLGRRKTDIWDSSATSLEQNLEDTFYVPFGSFYVPEPLGPSRRLVIHLRCSGASISPSVPVEVLLTSNRGQTTVCTVDAPDTWQTFTWGCSPDAIVTIQARTSVTAPGLRYFSGISAYWEEPSALIPGMSTSTTGIPLPSQDFPAQDRTASMAILRAMGRWMNRFTARGTRQVVAKYHPNNGHGYERIVPTGVIAAPGFVLKRYKIWVSGDAPLTCSWGQSSTAAGASITCELVGGASATVAASAGTCTLSVAVGAARVEELVVRLTTTGTGNFVLIGFYVSEDPIDVAAIPLPSGESLPVAMPALNRDLVRTESIIKSTGQTGLLDILQAMLYLLGTRTRYLVKDCGLVVARADGLAYAGAIVGLQATILGGIDDPVRLRIRAGVHARATWSELPGRVHFRAVTAPVGEWAWYSHNVQAPKASVDNASPTSGIPADGTLVTAWPEWLVCEPGTLAPWGLDGVRLYVDQTNGFYDAEWTGACAEQFIPEASVP